MYSYKDLAQKTGVSLRTVQAVIKEQGVKPAKKDGNRLLFDKSAVTVIIGHSKKARRRLEKVVDDRAELYPSRKDQLKDIEKKLDSISRYLSVEESSTLAEKLARRISGFDFEGASREVDQVTAQKMSQVYDLCLKAYQTTDDLSRSNKKLVAKVGDLEKVIHRLLNQGEQTQHFIKKVRKVDYDYLIHRALDSYEPGKSKLHVVK